MKRSNSFMWWFGVTLQLCFLLFSSCSEGSTSIRRALLKNDLTPASSSPAVKLDENHNQVVIDNGIVQVTLSKPEGYVLAISYNGIDNVLEAKNKDHNRGYLDVVWGNDDGVFQKIEGTKFSVIEKTEDQVEVSFLRQWTHSMDGSVPIKIDMRYIMRRGNSGYYSYAIFERPEGFPAAKVFQIRLVYKLRQDKFHYMAISRQRQRVMPTAEDRINGQELAYPEAVLLTTAKNPRIRGEVDDKYQYSAENKENCVHGWISFDTEPHAGFWVIAPSNEFRNGGPPKQDLTSHVGPTSLAMFVSTHYAGTSVSINFEKGETYKKVFGPVFVYLNSASRNNNIDTLWSDAVRQFNEEVRSWPYDFPRSPDFILPNQRGTVNGRLQVRDWFKKGWGNFNAKFAYVGLALPGENGSWQRESKGYQFWTQADENGYFEIKSVIPGDYNLYAWVPGFIGDYRYNTTITIKRGGVIKLGSLVYRPPRNGPTIWEIGVPDRSAAELYVPDPDPKLVNRLYQNDARNKFRQYGLWERYTDLYPEKDLVYNVGVDKHDKNWFFAHVARRTGKQTYQPTTWQIKFELDDETSSGNYTFQVALASANEARFGSMMGETLIHTMRQQGWEKTMR
ncbi:rhamnogalacturonate lyase B-like [Neltuma alba]|uniref:rhamnogalacturonate lyase B-like n=1 Tax=Neltuma alba TaxID=207710 RepID=UPI0010A402AE|nr:rhamnogalacturonate lyase B-like [Prosopis alba]